MRNLILSTDRLRMVTVDDRITGRLAGAEYDLAADPAVKALQGRASECPGGVKVGTNDAYPRREARIDGAWVSRSLTRFLCAGLARRCRPPSCGDRVHRWPGYCECSRNGRIAKSCRAFGCGATCRAVGNTTGGRRAAVGSRCPNQTPSSRRMWNRELSGARSVGAAHRRHAATDTQR